MLTDFAIAGYFIIGVFVAACQTANDERQPDDDFNIADVVFGWLAVSTFWPLIFISMAIEGFKE